MCHKLKTAAGKATTFEKCITANAIANPEFCIPTSMDIVFIEEFDKAETVRNLFYLAELDIKELDEVKDSPSKCIKLLNTASNRLTRRLNPAWKGDPIHVDLRYNPGNIMSVVI